MVEPRGAQFAAMTSTMPWGVCFFLNICLEAGTQGLEQGVWAVVSGRRGYRSRVWFELGKGYGWSSKKRVEQGVSQASRTWVEPKATWVEWFAHLTRRRWSRVLILDLGRPPWGHKVNEEYLEWQRSSKVHFDPFLFVNFSFFPCLISFL